MCVVPVTANEVIESVLWSPFQRFVCKTKAFVCAAGPPGLPSPLGRLQSTSADAITCISTLVLTLSGLQGGVPAP